MKRKLFIGLVFSAIAALCYSPPVAVAKDVGKCQVEKYSSVNVPVTAIMPEFSQLATLSTDCPDIPASAVVVPATEYLLPENISKAVVSLAIRRRDDSGPCSCERCLGKGTALVHVDPGSIG